MSTEASETQNKPTAPGAASEASKGSHEAKAGIPKRFAVGQTVCNEKNEKGKLCNGHLKELNTAHASQVHLRGDDVLHQCQVCGALYMGPPHGHVRDSRKQSRYVERDLAAILKAAGGTLPAYDYPVPEWRRASFPASTDAKSRKPAATSESPTASAPATAPEPASPQPSAPPATAAPAGETPAEKRARILAEFKAKNASKMVPVKKKEEGEEEAIASAQSDAPAAAPAKATPAPTTSSAASGETPEEKRARILAEFKAKNASKMPAPKATSSEENVTASAETAPAVAAPAPDVPAPAPASAAEPSPSPPAASIGETPAEKRARILAEFKAKNASKFPGA
jgi:hypothetical protein